MTRRDRRATGAGIALITAGLLLAAAPAGSAVQPGGSLAPNNPFLGTGGAQRAGYLDLRRDAQGRLVAAGFAADGSSSLDFLVTRLKASGGELDPDFGDGGHVRADLGSSRETATGVGIDSQGRIVVVGYNDAGNQDIEVLRLLPDGSRDTAFGDDGEVSVSVPGCGRGLDVAIDASDRILIAGTQNACPGDSGRNAAIVVRLHANGALDTSLDGDGIQGIDFSGEDRFEQFRAIAVRPDNGNIVAGGMARGQAEIADDADDLFVVEFPATGSTASTPPRTFVHDIDGARQGDWILDLEIDGQGRIVFTGLTDAAGEDSTALVGRLDNTLALDTSFGPGNDGLLQSDATSGTDYFTDLELAGDGRVLVTGVAETPGDPRDLVALARLRADGTLDEGFTADGTGRATFDPSDGASQTGRALVLDGTDGVVTAGVIDENDDGSGDQGFIQSLALTGDSRNDADPGGTSGGSGSEPGSGSSGGSDGGSDDGAGSGTGSGDDSGGDADGNADVGSEESGASDDGSGGGGAFGPMSWLLLTALALLGGRVGGAPRG